LQFYLQDDDFSFGEQPQDWNEQAVDRMLVTGAYLIGVDTARNITVPVIVRIRGARPDIAGASFERVNECAIQIDTGRLVIADCTDYFPNAAGIELAHRTYNALIGYKGLGTLSEDGLDSYYIFLWRQ
jgi:hypothetical protein